MTNISDLNIEEEILPLFDFTFNIHAAVALKDLFSKKLDSVEEILDRQQLLKGFLTNRDLFNDYSFSRFNLSEVHVFLETFFVGSVSGRSLHWKLMFSDKERQQKRGKLILMVRLFYKINTDYLCKMDTSVFPIAYADELEQIKKFFADFNLERYETAFRKNKFKIKHIVELMMLITEKTGNGQMATFWDQWFRFEAYLSICRGITMHGYEFPIFDQEHFILEGFYHPVLKKPVKNDLVVKNHVILLTGPNMSGKSTLLKALSLCVYLGHIGLAVAASKATMPFFSTIAVAINLTDSIVSGYSHFMSEIMTLKNVLALAADNAKCFAVFDELFRGTNIEDALEISTTTIRGLAHFPNSLFFISTHLHQLKEMEEIKSHKVATCYIECILTNNIPAFTYKIKEGWSDLKLGRILFEREGLNKMLEA